MNSEEKENIEKATIRKDEIKEIERRFTDDELFQAMMIEARAKLWTPRLEGLLRSWRRQICKRQKGYQKNSRKEEKLHYIFGIPSTIFSAITSTSIFATYQNCDTCTGTCTASKWIRLAAGAFAAFTMALSAFHLFMGYQGRSVKSKTSSDDCESLIRNIDTILLLPPSLRQDPVSSLQHIRSAYDDIIKNGPNLSVEYDTQLTYTVIAKNSDVIESSSEDNGSENNADIEMGIRRKNAEKISIPFDLDTARPQQFEQDKYMKEVQQSLAKAIQFELTRLDRSAEPKNNFSV